MSEQQDDVSEKKLAAAEPEEVGVLPSVVDEQEVWLRSLKMPPCFQKIEVPSVDIAGVDVKGKLPNKNLTALFQAQFVAPGGECVRNLDAQATFLGLVASQSNTILMLVESYNQLWAMCDCIVATLQEPTDKKIGLLGPMLRVLEPLNAEEAEARHAENLVKTMTAAMYHSQFRPRDTTSSSSSA